MPVFSSDAGNRGQLQHILKRACLKTGEAILQGPIFRHLITLDGSSFRSAGVYDYNFSSANVLESLWRHNHERAIIFAVLLVGAAIAKCHTLMQLRKQEFIVSVLGPESEIKVSAG